MKDLQVGATIYLVNGTPVKIVGETKVSWLVSSSYSWQEPEKISKKAMRENNHDGAYWPTYWATKEDAEKVRFYRQNRHSVGREVAELSDPEMLRKVAELIGYKEKP